ncbi:hypothetical protein CVU83_00595 [Candidatus Falkowbacteria bacterium HGW-Falkowbacteria-2]|uniref:GtrA/DPMS transmembrane domain-containing protein n=1 Tax=Candidatus Falkowbacteria bacterium HGW-Falkowbacteria-2 TaxID=2013769 RepID=A0A2N2E338_9BACT|nr:MAG: hypothetical protein CVU83_00595 [Candidatus Falkowbacteria bacterium HGW-Falkowbacteria-2]
MPVINRLYIRFRNFLLTCHPGLFNFCEARKSVIKFFLSGGLAGVVDLVALYIFHGVFKWDIVVATSAAFLCSFVVSFSLQKLWTFRNYSQVRLPRQLFMYFGSAFIAMYFNGWAMHMLVNNLGVWYLLSQIIVNLFLGVVNYFNYRFIIFRKTINET